MWTIGRFSCRKGRKEKRDMAGSTWDLEITGRRCCNEGDQVQHVGSGYICPSFNPHRPRSKWVQYLFHVNPRDTHTSTHFESLWKSRPKRTRKMLLYNFHSNHYLTITADTRVTLHGTHGQGRNIRSKKTKLERGRRHARKCKKPPSSSSSSSSSNQGRQ